jgi:hypothetical protein
MKILLATPSKDHTVFVPYLKSVLSLQRWLAKRTPDAELQVETKSNQLVDMARNFFATWLLLDRSFTHLLFVDADMGFEPELIGKMIEFDKPVVGAMYPSRVRNDRRWVAAARRTDDVTQASAIASEFVPEGAMMFDPVGPGQRMLRVDRGFCQLSYTGAGILLIQRAAVETMRDAFPELWATDAPVPLRIDRAVPNGLFQPFAPMQNENGFFVSEDIAFSLRWTKACGGEIWSCIDETITHSGPTTYTGNFQQKLERMRALGIGIAN